MPSYIFACRHHDASETVQRKCQGREQAIAYARRYLEQALKETGPSNATASVTVGEEHQDSEPRWLGSWDWGAEDGWVWTPLE
jgi:hypothetical protein